VSMTCTSRVIWAHEFLLSYTSGIYFICAVGKGHTLCLPADYALGKCLTHIIVQRTATVSSEPSIVYHPIPELLHHLNYARAVSDFILIYLSFLLWYVKW
jgi:hypothetical protein